MELPMFQMGRDNTVTMGIVFGYVMASNPYLL